jgi:hypothetical protein
MLAGGAGEWEDGFTFRVSCRLNCGVNIGAPGLASSLRSVPVGADGASNFSLRLNFRLGITRLSQLFRRGPLWRSPSLGWCCYYLCVIAGGLAQEKEAGPAARGLKLLALLQVQIQLGSRPATGPAFPAAGSGRLRLRRSEGGGRPGVVGRTGPACQRLRCHSARSAPTQPWRPWCRR